MKYKGLRVFIAVAIGIFCGLAIMAKATIWYRLLGTLSAGSIAYFGFAPLAVLRAIPRAVALASQRLADWFCNNRRYFFRWFMAAVFFATWSIFVSLFFRVVMLVTNLGTIAIGILFWVFLLAAYIDIQSDYSARQQWMFFLKGNPLAVFSFYLPRLLIQYVFKVIIWLVSFLFWHLPCFLFWSTPCFLFRFAWHLFVLIHSQERLVCMIDAMIGTVMAGYILDVNQWTARLLGAVAGGLFGVFNYEVIAKRWLRLPQKQQAALASR